MCSYVLLTLNNRLLILKLHSYNRLLMLAYFTTLQFRHGSGDVSLISSLSSSTSLGFEYDPPSYARPKHILSEYEAIIADEKVYSVRYSFSFKIIVW